MPKLRALAAKEIITFLEKYGFVLVSQKGSHAKLQREVNGIRQTLTIPHHSELDRGTTGAIYRQTSRFIPETDLHKLFYAE
jgi:predicted RNA binding protein YcfA (HicA-like mRNA interferase family)